MTDVEATVPGTHHTADVNGIRMHYVLAGQGPPVVLLHGFPETWFAWRKQIPALAEHYSLIVPDLRGYGDTAKPDTGYDKRTMATDVRELLRRLGHDRVALVGHDRGARVATRFAKDHRDVVDRLVVMDNIPTRVIFQSLDATSAKLQWWFLFNQVPHLPEALIAGREEMWLRHFFGAWSYDPQMLTDDEIAVYVRAYSQPGAVRGACNDYRAAAQDVAQDERDADQLIDCPTLALWGEDFDAVGQFFDVLETWRGMAHDVRGISIPQCAHLPHEERPDVVNSDLLAFLSDWKG
jgi:pimeloyl-ACP methyl ester carboxylesterase